MEGKIGHIPTSLGQARIQNIITGGWVNKI